MIWHEMHPYYWAKHDLTVIGDSFNEFSQMRAHMVIEKVPPGLVLSNAEIYSIQDHPEGTITWGDTYARHHNLPTEW